MRKDPRLGHTYVLGLSLEMYMCPARDHLQLKSQLKQIVNIVRIQLKPRPGTHQGGVGSPKSALPAKWDGQHRQQRLCLQCRRPECDPQIGKTPWMENGSPLHYSGLENPIDRGAW